MDRRNFLGGLVAAGGLAVVNRAEASPLFKLVNSDAAAGKKAKGRFDEDLVVFISDIHCNPDSYQPAYLKKVVDDILAMKPLPANVIALGDLAFQTGQPYEYACLKKVIAPIEEAGIKLTMAMGNHDRREEFGEAFPHLASKSLLPNRYVYKVETPKADFIVLDSLQQGEDKTKWITPGFIDENQKEWLRKTLSGYVDKPVFVCTHHPITETQISDILLACPCCSGYIYGHNHRFRKDWMLKSYSDRRIIRSLCIPSTGHWGDIGHVELRLEDDKAVATLMERDFFFPAPAASPEEAPALWREIAADQKGASCNFSYCR
ncbi:MAG: metallophosphoesterase [Bacteroidales bacterium]|nr:metallophosphoesterase [Bacteroidales bacterium]